MCRSCMYGTAEQKAAQKDELALKCRNDDYQHWCPITMQDGDSTLVFVCGWGTRGRADATLCRCRPCDAMRYHSNAGLVYALGSLMSHLRPASGYG